MEKAVNEYVWFEGKWVLVTIDINHMWLELDGEDFYKCYDIDDSIYEEYFSNDESYTLEDGLEDFMYNK